MIGLLLTIILRVCQLFRVVLLTIIIWNNGLLMFWVRV